MVLRRYLKKRLEHASLSNVGIERTPKKVTINIFTARPGIVIGKKGEEVERLKGELQHLTGKDIYINIREIKRPEVDAQLVGDNIARQLEKRIAFRRCMKKAVSTSMRLGAHGIKVMLSGRLGGAEIARTEKYSEGRLPLHTLRSSIDFAMSRAETTAGTIGIKVWIFKGERGKRESAPGSQEKFERI
jgi:small subunit ribosomal protein S3